MRCWKRKIQSKLNDIVNTWESIESHFKKLKCQQLSPLRGQEFKCHAYQTLILTLPLPETTSDLKWQFYDGCRLPSGCLNVQNSAHNSPIHDECQTPSAKVSKLHEKGLAHQDHCPLQWYPVGITHNPYASFRSSFLHWGLLQTRIRIQREVDLKLNNCMGYRLNTLGKPVF